MFKLDRKYYDDYFVYGDQFTAMNFSEVFQYFPTHEAWDIYAFIIKARRAPERKFTLLTHNSDWSVGQVLDLVGLQIENIPTNLYWFAQNVDVESPLIESIPIGLENSHWHPSKPDLIMERINNVNEKGYKYLCCAMFNTGTNPRRKAILEHFKQFDWCYTKETTNGSHFEEYINIVDESMFCVCPEGNGIDTHRFWEASYLQSIPVVEDSVNIKFYKEMPMLSFGSLLDVTREDLIQQTQITTASYFPLDIGYWKDKIYGKVYREGN